MGGGAAASALLAPGELTVEGRISPLDVGRAVPRLSWHSHVDAQSAYEIEVASSAQLLAAGRADLWDSGKTTDARSVAIAYAGKPLGSREQAYWRVRVWQSGRSTPGPWSRIASWQMALLKPADWQARWITSPLFPAATSSPGIERWLAATAADPQFKNPETVSDTIEKLRDVRPATYFRKTFTIDRPVKSARLYSTSAGYSEFFLSGEKIGDRVLNPAQTDFDKRIYYDVDDLTERLGVGEHVLGIHLGNGFYAERTAFGLDKLFYGEPAAIAQLEITFEDGTQTKIVTDGSWQAHPSPILKNGVYSGEVFDARERIAGWNSHKAGVGNKWHQASVLDTSPTLALVAAEMPPVRRMREVKPKAIYNPAENVWTIDFGQNFTGLPRIDMAQFNLAAGQAVVLRYAEWADAAGRIGMNSGGGAPRTKQVDAYISDGEDAQPWSPSFTWHGFRYLEISGLDTAPPLGAFTAHLTRTDVPVRGRFSSSNPLLNRIHETALWTFESNLVSVPSDCPIRERNGWTGDALATATMASYNFGMEPFFEKYLGDFRTTEMVAPTIVPGRRTRSGKVDWASAEIFLTWEHYLHSGDLSVIERQYDSMLEYFDYAESVMTDDLVTNPDNYYGDWCDILPELGKARPLGRCQSYNTPPQLTATALVRRANDLMTEMADRVGHEDDARRFRARRDAIGKAFHAAFFDTGSGGYGSQTANAMALMFDIVPPELRTAVAKDLDRDVRQKWNGHASVGALGMSWLYPALGDHGYGDTAFRTFTAEGPPGYSYLFDGLGGTSLWEDISQYVPEKGDQPGKSLSHPFKGGYDAWFFSGLGGINPDPENPGFKHFFLSPVFPADLDKADVSFETGYGTILSAWSRNSEGIVWHIAIPQNTTASVKLGNLPETHRQFGPGHFQLQLDAAGNWQKTTQTGGGQ